MKESVVRKNLNLLQNTLKFKNGDIVLTNCTTINITYHNTKKSGTKSETK
jgi:hypothetical protein